MEIYCISCNINTAKGHSGVKEIKQTRLLLLSNCAFCGNKKSTLKLKIKEHRLV